MCIRDIGYKQSLLTKLKLEWSTKRKLNLKISSVTLRRLIKRLSIGEEHNGIDPLFSRWASDKILNILNNFLMACYSHCFFPDEIFYGDIIPTIKDNKGNISESSRNSPVMQSSCILTFIELYWMEILSENIHFNSRTSAYSLIFPKPLIM